MTTVQYLATDRNYEVTSTTSQASYPVRLTGELDSPSLAGCGW